MLEVHAHRCRVLRVVTFRNVFSGRGTARSACQAFDQARFCRIGLAHFAGPPVALSAALPPSCTVAARLLNFHAQAVQLTRR